MPFHSAQAIMSVQQIWGQEKDSSCIMEIRCDHSTTWHIWLRLLNLVQSRSTKLNTLPLSWARGSKSNMIHVYTLHYKPRAMFITTYFQSVHRFKANMRLLVHHLHVCEAGSVQSTCRQPDCTGIIKMNDTLKPVCFHLDQGYLEAADHTAESLCTGWCMGRVPPWINILCLCRCSMDVVGRDHANALRLWL